MVQKDPLAGLPKELVKLVESYERNGPLLCQTSAEALAVEFRLVFGTPAPLTMDSTYCFVRKLESIHVYYQPNMEHTINVRGLWMSFGDNNYIFIDADRPKASRIGTLIHEISEKMRAISHVLHPEIPELPDSQREAWANRVAAAVKIPPELFLSQINEVGLDLELLREANDETLACVARRSKDLVMEGHAYYWSLFEIAPYGLKKCDKLAQIAERWGGACIRVRDVTHTTMIDYGRRGPSLPGYNLPSYYHYRILHPMMNRYIERNTPVLIHTLEGGAGDDFGYHDLFGTHHLSVLLVPYGLSKTRGFFMLAVHPSERSWLQHIIERRQPEEHSALDWLFSWYSYTHKQPTPKQDQIEIPGLGNEPAELQGLFAKRFGSEPYSFLPDTQEDDTDDSTEEGAA